MLIVIRLVGLAAFMAVVIWLFRRPKREEVNETGKCSVPKRCILLGQGGVMDTYSFPLQGSALHIGTDPDRCAIIYPPDTPGIFPDHCMLYELYGEWYLVDACADTYRNGEWLRPAEPVRLNFGDVIRLGETDNSFLFQEVNTNEM